MCRYVVLSHRGSNQGCVMFLDYEIGMIFLKGKQISSFCVQEVIFQANIICTRVFVACSRASWKSAPWVYASGGVIFGRSKLPILPGLEPAGSAMSSTSIFQPHKLSIILLRYYVDGGPAGRVECNKWCNNALISSSKRGHNNYRRQCRRVDPCHVREIG